MLNCVTNCFNYTCDVSHLLYIVAPAFSSTHSFCRARSHDYLVALPAVAGDLAVASMDDAPLVSAGASASAPLICAASTGIVCLADFITNSIGFMTHPVSAEWSRICMVPLDGAT